MTATSGIPVTINGETVHVSPRVAAEIEAVRKERDALAALVVVMAEGLKPFVTEWERLAPSNVIYAPELSEASAKIMETLKVSRGDCFRARTALSTLPARARAVQDVVECLGMLVKYARWQINEGGSHHPTLPSAVAKAETAIAALGGKL